LGDQAIIDSGPRPWSDCVVMGVVHEVAVPSVAELIPVLQIAIGPVILISGVGLLLLSMTNRLGRAIDRSRVLCQELSTEAPEERPNTRWRR
jgi:hypothetical protein